MIKIAKPCFQTIADTLSARRWGGGGRSGNCADKLLCADMVHYVDMVGCADMVHFG